MIPAAGTRFQKDAGIEDDADLFAEDIQRKAKGEELSSPRRRVVEKFQRCDRMVVEIDHGLPFSVVTDFDYPGHSRRRMHGLPTRSGQELVDRLRSACEEHGIDIVCNHRVKTLFVDDDHVAGLEAKGRDDTVRVGCKALVLACNGFGGNREMVAEHMPEIENALWFGHDGNRGDAITWGKALGAECHHLGAYQGHGNVAHPHGILITWAVITEGGFSGEQQRRAVLG